MQRILLKLWFIQEWNSNIHCCLSFPIIHLDQLKKNHLILAQLMKYIAIFATNYPTTFSGNNHNDLKTQIFYKMKHFIFILFANIFAILNAQNTSVTIYYDKNLKGVSDEAFATYKAVFAEPTDTNYQKQFVITYLPLTINMIIKITFNYKNFESYYFSFFINIMVSFNTTFIFIVKF